MARKVEFFIANEDRTWDTELVEVPDDAEWVEQENNEAAVEWAWNGPFRNANHIVYLTVWWWDDNEEMEDDLEDEDDS